MSLGRTRHVDIGCTKASISRERSSPPGKRKPAQMKADGDNPVAQRLGGRQGNSMLALIGRKRCRPESDGDIERTDVGDGSDLGENLEEDEEDQDANLSRHARLSSPGFPEDFDNFTHLLIDWAFPLCRRWMGSARYIHPPEHRMPPRKRSRKPNETTRSVFIEVEDLDDPSTILILRIDGYFHLSCPFSISDPGHYESCTLEHDLRSITDLIRHLAKCHPHPFYCPICGQIFEDDLTCDSHIRARLCDCRDFDIARGVSHSQLRKITEQDDRNQREEERWQRIYSCLFPGADRPQCSKAYLEQGLPLAVSMARDYWESHGRGLIEQYVAKEGLPGGKQLTRESFSTLCEHAGRELVQRVVKDAQGDRDGQSELEVEAEWEMVKAEHD